MTSATLTLDAPRAVVDIGDGITLYHGKSEHYLPYIGDGQVDLVLADLPYSTTAFEWDCALDLDELWREYKRILRPGGVVVLFGSQPFTTALINSNPRWFRYEWIWRKSVGGGFLAAKKTPLKRHENILVFCSRGAQYDPQRTAGKPYRVTSGKSSGAFYGDDGRKAAGWTTVSDGRRYPTSVLDHANETGSHPTQKPTTLLRYLIRTHSREGDLVVDNTMGSGSTGVAAIETRRRFVGIELDDVYFGRAVDRCKAAYYARNGDALALSGHDAPLQMRFD